MKYFILLFLFLTSCATTGGGDKILLPQVEKKVNQHNISEAAKTKYRIGEKYGQYFDFFYGPRGSYYIVVTSESGKGINLSDYDITLSVNSDTAQNPEFLSMALEDAQVLSGFGEVREGRTQFELTLTPVDSSMNRPMKFNFNVNINFSL